LYKFQQDSIYRIESSKGKTDKDKYSLAIRNNTIYVEKSLYQLWLERVGEDSLIKMTKKGMLPRFD
jgi:hypothetical protein